MNRRKFIKLSSYSLASLWACQNEFNQWSENKFDISIQSDLEIGHKIFDLKSFIPQKVKTTQTLIVGGGIAGMSAALNLKNHDSILCELSSNLGGSSSAMNYKGKTFTQGAHYDLSYPDYFGQETLGLLEDLNIIKFNAVSGFWEFVDKKHIINSDYELQCLENKTYRETLLKKDKTFSEFRKILTPYTKNLKLPSRLIAPEFRSLDKITFYDFLNKFPEVTPDLVKGIDYQMIDDFSGTSTEISALAGLYYYVNRPYQSQKLQIFSPPEGNFYFINKMKEKLNDDIFHQNHLVFKIEKKKNKFESLVLDVSNQQVIKIKSDHIVYAGQKHALKYVSNKDYKLFSDNSYAPWVIVNLVLKGIKLEKGYWQNEILNTDKKFMGFVDSDAQASNKDYRILTAYYCFPSWARKRLLDIDSWANQFVNQTVENMAYYFGKKPSFIHKHTSKVFIKVMGHAMPIVKPNFLFKDKNDLRPEKNFVYAGVDNSRLPLMFEALDSGLVASKLIL